MGNFLQQSNKQTDYESVKYLEKICCCKNKNILGLRNCPFLPYQNRNDKGSKAANGIYDKPKFMCGSNLFTIGTFVTVVVIMKISNDNKPLVDNIYLNFKMKAKRKLKT
jgi:hypothetical protein